VLKDREPPLEDDAGENYHDREPSEVILLLLLSTRERYVFFLLGPEQGDDDEIVKRTSERIWGNFFAINWEGMEGYKKSTCTIT